MKQTKDSGIEWIGEIPEKWHLERLMWHLEEVKESNNPIKTNNVLSLTNKLGVVPYEDKGAQGNVAKADYSQYKIAYPNTIVVNSMNILIGSVGICNYYGCVSPVYYVYKVKEKTSLAFINYIFQTEQFQKELRKYANGILEIRLRVSSSDILKQTIAIPAYEEQTKVVDEINIKAKQIKSLVDNLTNQIDKLKEYKKALITKCVTKGLDPNVPLKDSGIDWIGEIPENWNITSIKNLFSLFAGATPDSNNPVNWDGDIIWITPSDFKTDDMYVSNGKRNLSSIGYNSCSATLIDRGSIIFSKRAPIGSVSIATTRLCTNQGCISCVPNKNSDSLYYYFVLSVITEQFESYAFGTTFKEISLNNFANFKIVYPPFENQLQISSYLDKKCSEIDALISSKQQQIDKLNEYHKSLIYEYVTGKKEVV